MACIMSESLSHSTDSFSNATFAQRRATFDFTSTFGTIFIGGAKTDKVTGNYMQVT